MVWVLFVLSLIELVVVHFLVALKWPMIGWTLTIISALGAVWLVRWILSFKRLPHELGDEGLTLHLGSLMSVDLDFDNIASIQTSFEPGALEKKGKLNLAFIAHPNRCFELKQPIMKDKARVYVRFDDPAAFDAAFDKAIEMRAIVFN